MSWSSHSSTCLQFEMFKANGYAKDLLKTIILDSEATNLLEIDQENETQLREFRYICFRALKTGQL